MSQAIKRFLFYLADTFSCEADLEADSLKAFLAERGREAGELAAFEALLDGLMDARITRADADVMDAWEAEIWPEDFARVDWIMAEEVAH